MLTIVIQAGGESRRMGQDKALLPFLGRPLIERVIQRVRSLGDEILITSNRAEDYGFLGLPLYSDLVPGRGALGGLYTALFAASQPLVAVVACDMPFVSPDLLGAQRQILLETQADIAIPRSGEGLEPFHAVYRRQSCLPAIQAALQADRWRVDSWFSQVKVHILKSEEIQRHDPRLLAFRNVNTPEELLEAENLARQIDPPG
jgi:molybdopterin-guanine dinucleotide biosynthesis protein A